MLLNKGKSIAYGGIITALSIIFIYLSTIIPFNKIFFLACASFLIPIGVIFTSLKNCWLIYISSALLSLLLIGFKGNVFFYILFFGPYGIIKNYIEKLNNLPLEIILKLLYFNGSIALIYVLFKTFISTLKNIPIPIPMFILIAQIIFLIFDYILTLFIYNISKYNKA